MARQVHLFHWVFYKHEQKFMNAVLEAMDKMSRHIQSTLDTTRTGLQELFVQRLAQATEGIVSIPARREAVNAIFSIRFNCSTVAVQKKGKERHWIGCHGATKVSQYGLRWHRSSNQNNNNNKN
jgi:hypothetical protein